MKGILTKKDGNFSIKWTDLRSSNKDCIILTPLISNNVYKYNDGDWVDFEIITYSYDENDFTPNQYAILLRLDKINELDKTDKESEMTLFLKNILNRMDEHIKDIEKYENMFKETKNGMYIDYVKNYSIRLNELKNMLQYCL